MRFRPALTIPVYLVLAAMPATVCAETPDQPAIHALPLPWPPGFSRDVQGSGLPGLDGGHAFLWNRPTGFDAVSTLRIDRHIPDGSGEPGHTYKALWALGSSGPHNAGYEWTITGELHNRSLASTGAQNVAVNGTIFKEANGVGPVGPSWAGNFNCVDMTDEADPVASCIGAEIDVSAQSPTTDRNRQRVGLQISTGGVPGAHTGYGILLGNLTGSVTDRGFSFQGEGTYGIGIDTAAGRFSGVPILLGSGQSIAVDGHRDGSFARTLGFDGRDLVYGTARGAVFKVSDAGQVQATSVREAQPNPPRNSQDACTPGDHAWDEAFEYRCVAPDRWKRAALSDW
ncbi:hypothetical protein AO398_06155 [Methylobacterium sp. GXS13]|uniref:hypothetical protein n=1 Tax=Methylobacterium sp. GXS13 TaxID=1730094 RepID=UPI00071BEC63|nr:hypothetical protein [Methylobacterium sp. GXS13]KST58389.1 hypothetical protein AO398_06155 [Methylobacterium sp. GXS13]